MKRWIMQTSRAALLAGVVFTLGAAPEEAPPEHVQWMKDLGSQMGALRKGVDVEKNASDMEATMKHVLAFWKARNSEIGVKTSDETTAGAAAIARAAKASDKEGIAAGMKMVGAGCKGCHDVHREKVAENVYRMK